MKVWEWFQIAMNWLKKPVPRWIIELVTQLGKLLIALFKSVAVESYIKSIERKIMDMSNTNFSNEEKFNAVWDFSKTLLPALSESDLDTIIQNLFKKLKEAGLV